MYVKIELEIVTPANNYTVNAVNQIKKKNHLYNLCKYLKMYYRPIEASHLLKLNTLYIIRYCRKIFLPTYK